MAGIRSSVFAGPHTTALYHGVYDPGNEMLKAEAKDHGGDMPTGERWAWRRENVIVTVDIEGFVGSNYLNTGMLESVVLAIDQRLKRATGQR